MSRGSGRAVNVTDGELIKPPLVLSLPIILTNLLQVGYDLADTFRVGRLGQDAVSAIPFSWSIVFPIITIAGGFAVAGTVLARNKGAGNLGEVDHVAGRPSGSSSSSRASSRSPATCSPHDSWRWSARPRDRTCSRSRSRTRGRCSSASPSCSASSSSGRCSRGWGDTRTPLYPMAFGVALNVAAGPFLILGFDDNPVFGALGLTGLI